MSFYHKVQDLYIVYYILKRNGIAMADLLCFMSIVCDLMRISNITQGPRAGIVITSASYSNPTDIMSNDAL